MKHNVFYNLLEWAPLGLHGPYKPNLLVRNRILFVFAKNSAKNLSTQSLALGSFLAGAANDGNLTGMSSGIPAPSSFKPFTPGMKYQVPDFDNPLQATPSGFARPCLRPLAPGPGHLLQLSKRDSSGKREKNRLLCKRQENRASGVRAI